jgi:hypothetical protein
MVMIPFINRTVDIILSDRLEACDVNVHEVIDEFQGQCDNFHDLFEAFVLIVPHSWSACGVSICIRV